MPWHRIRFSVCLTALACTFPLLTGGLPEARGGEQAGQSEIHTPTDPHDTVVDNRDDNNPTQPARDDGETAVAAPRVELYIPSVSALAAAARRSKTAALADALSGLMPKPQQESDEGFDFDALADLAERIAGWPDTSIAATTYTQDPEGRPRWAVRLDWPLEDLVARLEAVLNDPEQARLLKGIALKRVDDEHWRLEQPDLSLAVLSRFGTGSLLASARDLRPPEALFGQVSESSGNSKKKRSLVYCRLNLDVKEPGGGASLFTQLSGLKSVLYAGSLRRDGRWSERFAVSWNPLVGVAIKAVFQKARHTFLCPREAYATAVINMGLAEGAADGLAGLPPNTIGSRVGGEMAFAVVPGEGFLPFPDVYCQFRARRTSAIQTAIRSFIQKDNKKRAEDDRPPAWHEECIDDRVVFWKDPSAETGYGFMPVTYRTVVFFEPSKAASDTSDDDGQPQATRLIIANTSTWADDAVHHWQALQRTTVSLPSSKKNHWQARISWRRLYALAQPYLALLSGFSEDTSLPPEPGELVDALPDSDIAIRIGLAGLQARHKGPIPIGAIYVPTVVAVSLGATADPSSEAARERTASRHLRALYHHAKLFKKDYGRWPATVAELDGYVDFGSHAELLRLRPKEKSFIEGLASLIGGEKQADRDSDEADEPDIDDSLYVIDWTENEAEWRLSIRNGEFVKYETIYIDAAGEIHRVEKAENGAAEERRPIEAESERRAKKKKRPIAL
ncbi:MAG: hypothetical protein ACE5E1_06380 [Phycisphaerae bacterium]